ncbi:MAG TPA: hypothetical protein VK504_16230 [Vicinamibacterales bacterium]|jgi:hypothetical protein|nr:hypothetical protein [Vicinamibacterales bacterium]
MTSRLVTSLRDRVQLRSRLRRLMVLYSNAASAPPPAPKNAVDPARLNDLTKYKPEVPGHAEVFLRDAQGLFEPVLDDLTHWDAALAWLLRAQEVTACGGFSVGYSFAHGWLPAYPETTGYIIPTLWDAVGLRGDDRFREAALAAADWEIAIQLPCGATRAGYEGDPDGFWSQGLVPAAFNTGQVMQGWNRTFVETGDARYLDAARRAADFLADCVDKRGVFVKGLSPGPLSRTRAYYARAAYGLASTGVLTDDHRYLDIARRHLDWVIEQQRPNGFVSYASFVATGADDDALTHPLAYVAEGLLETGLLLNESRYIDASRLIAASMMHVCEKRGLFLPATLTRRLTSGDRYSCLPGNAQFACLWLRHGMMNSDWPMVNTGLKMVDWLKGVQSLTSENPGIRGGLAGSWPVDGGYSVFAYLDWAAKFFADSLLLAHAARQRLRES